MRRRRRLVGTAFTASVVAALALGGAVGLAGKPARHAFSPARAVTVNCRSAALGGHLPALVYLPAGYPHGGARYRVVYFLHGLPASPAAYTANAFVAGALRVSQKAIVVAPQGARNANSDREYLDWDAAEDWPQAISQDLPHCIDHRFRTVANRTGRTLVGLSAGGYGAFNIGLRHLAVFAAVESWSGYFAATDPSGEHILELGSPRADSDGRVPSGIGLKSELATWPSLLAFYVGNQDTRFLTMNQRYDAALRASGVRHRFAIYSGGHSPSLWRSEAAGWLSLALSYMSREAHRRGR